MGYSAALLIVGSVLSVFGMMMLSLCKEYWQIMLTQGVCAGLGCGLLYTPSVSLVTAAFSSRRSLALSVTNSGISIGALFPFPS